MEIPILITGDDATGYTATDCFGRMASGASKLEAVHLMKRMHARDESAENLTSISVQSIHPMAFNKPKPQLTEEELRWEAEYDAEIARTRRERDELEGIFLTEEPTPERSQRWQNSRFTTSQNPRLLDTNPSRSSSSS